MFEKNENPMKNTVYPEKTPEDLTIELARNYEDIRFAQGFIMKRINKGEKKYAQRLFDMVGSSAHIIDIPCGNGRFFKIFSNAKKLTMVDFSVNMLKRVKEKYNISENVQLIQSDISSVPLPNNSADLCFCMRLFHHMKDDIVRLGALKELARISRKYVALSFYTKSCLRYCWRRMPMNYITFSHMIDLAKQAGLEPIEHFPKLSLTAPQCLVTFRKT
jgi:ubiquinone/menaquinone biosynthesis C-methylase UbiE